MPIDPNIALGVRPVEQPNMLGQMGQMMALRQANEEYQSNNALKDFYAQGGDLSRPEDQRRLMSTVGAKGADLIAKQFALQKTKEEVKQLGYKNVESAFAQSREALSAIDPSAPNAGALLMAWHEANHKDPVMGSVLATSGIDAASSRAALQAAIAKGPAAIQEAIRRSSMGQAKYQAELMQTERSHIAAGPGNRNADLLREKYNDELNYGGAVVTTTMPNPETGEPMEVQTRRNIRGGGLIPLEVQAPPVRVDISPSSATATPVAATGGSSNVLATQVAPQGGVAPAANVNALNPNAPQTQGPILAKPLPRVPSGPLAAYRKTADGTGLEPIPGGPEDPAVKAKQSEVKLSAKDLATREAKYPQATSALKAFEAKTAQFDKVITELIDNKKGLDEITGFLAGRTDISAMSDAGRRALTLFNTVTAKGGFSELQDMRNASPTGGALGNVSNQEGKQLIDSFGALSRTQSGNDLRKSLTTAKSDLENLKTRMREAYDMTYEYRAGKASSGGAALPAGFVAD